MHRCEFMMVGIAGEVSRPQRKAAQRRRCDMKTAENEIYQQTTDTVVAGHGLHFYTLFVDNRVETVY